ncbi:hypothetical protein J6590_022597 [Homalodisca vitripennis]|nr:hypothetical protein J6590_022597 [Homalodisca vitripennis]
MTIFPVLSSTELTRDIIEDRTFQVDSARATRDIIEDRTFHVIKRGGMTIFPVLSSTELTRILLRTGHSKLIQRGRNDDIPCSFINRAD